MEPPAEKMYQTESESSESSDSDAEDKANFLNCGNFLKTTAGKFSEVC